MSLDTKQVKDTKNLKDVGSARRSFLGKVAYVAPVVVLLGGLKAQAQLGGSALEG
jgi:hypothetical protein